MGKDLPLGVYTAELSPGKRWVAANHLSLCGDIAHSFDLGR